MNWRTAFLKQARSDNQVRVLLNSPDVDVPYSHQLHYLQMVTEKLSKAYLAGPDADSPPQPTHIVFVRFLQTLLSNPAVRAALGFEGSHKQYVAYIKSLLPLAAKIEALAPSKDRFHSPNPEYPWMHQGEGRIVVPIEHAFREFDPSDPKLGRLLKLIQSLLELDI